MKDEKAQRDKADSKENEHPQKSEQCRFHKRECGLTSNGRLTLQSILFHEFDVTLGDVACPEEITIVTGLTFGIANTTRCPERWRFGAVWCAEHQEFLKLRLTTIKGRQPRKKFVRAGRATVRHGSVMWLGGLADGAEWGGDFVEPWMELDRLRQLLDSEINGAAADAVAVGVAVNPV